MSDTFDVPRRYAPKAKLSTDNPPQRVGRPRPGHGTVYFNLVGDRDGVRAWSGTWIDRYPAPDADGVEVGVQEFEGERAETLAWVRSRDAAQRLAYSDHAQQFVPLPHSDDEVDI